MPRSYRWPRGCRWTWRARLLGAAVLGGGALAPRVPAQDAPAAPAALAIRDVTVIDVTDGRLLPAQTVVVVGTRVQAVGPAGAIGIPAGARVVDGRGKYLLPGLWDLHTHSNRMTDLFYPLFIANGVTGIRDASSEVPLDTLVRWRREILAGTRVGPPRQILSGPAIDEERSCGRREIHVCVTDPMDARHVVDSLKAAGADMIKSYEMSDSMYFAIAAEARRVGIRLGGHVPAVTAIAASDSGASIIDHSSVNQELRDRCLYDAASVEQCRPVAARLARNNTWWVPTWVMPPRFEGNPARSQAIYERFDEFLRGFWADSGPPAGLQDYLRPRVSATDSTSTPGSLGHMYIARGAGLPVLAGTDAAALDGEYLREVPAGFTLLVELMTYVAEGLTPLEALQTATLNPAKMLHGTDSLGTVDVGKLADLVLLDGNPLADITNLAAIRAVVANGRYFDRATLDGLLVEVRAKARAIP